MSRPVNAFLMTVLLSVCGGHAERARRAGVETRARYETVFPDDESKGTLAIEIGGVCARPLASAMDSLVHADGLRGVRWLQRPFVLLRMLRYRDIDEDQEP
jgi:hypothetical protein